MDGLARFRDELAEFATLEPAPSAPEREARHGRRPLPPQLRTDPFSLRLTPEERRIIAAAAELVGSRTAATWARAALTEAARRLLEQSPAPVVRLERDRG